MNAGWNHIAKSIFERPDVENISLDELDFLVEEYPYFPVIHFLRTRKLLADQVSPALSGVARTALYFPNPHWLNFQLEAIPIPGNQEPALSEIMTTPSGVEELDSFIEEESPVPEAEIIQEETETFYDDKRVFNPGEPEKEETPTELASTNFDTVETEISPETEAEGEFQNEQQELEGVQSTTELQELAVEETEVEPLIEEPAVDNSKVESQMEPQDLTTVYTETEPIVESKEQSVDYAETESLVELQEPEFENQVESSESDLTIQSTEPELVEAENIDNDVQAGIELPSMEVSTGPGNENLEIPIEPLFAVDYFASQGIKLKLEEEATDKLSIKLRSFTDWLKAMKKIHPEKLDHKMNQEEENNIRVYAETSNEPKELYSESLAEVYLQQGLRQKAVQVFEKLSLLDPSKSAYFAARIREIKEN